MVHLEITSRCNASCPMCARNIRGGKVNPNLALTDLGLVEAKKIFPQQFLAQLNKIYLCGNYGDPVASSQTLEVLEYFREMNPQLKIGIHSNGGARDAAWWARLAKVVSYCRFGIDGLQDTNHLYRQGVVWDRLMKNVESFIAAGGRAEWDFLLFKHNQHQVEEVRALSKSMGFQLLQIKNTSRFFDAKNGVTTVEYPVMNSKGEFSHNISPSSLPDYENRALENDYRDVIARFGSVESYWDHSEIDCRVIGEKSIYVSAQGLVFPCCWTANQMFISANPHANPVVKMLAQMTGQEQALSGLQHSVQDVVGGEFFQKLLPESWQQPSIAAGKLQVCAKTCGKCVKPFESQFVSHER